MAKRQSFCSVLIGAQVNKGKADVVGLLVGEICYVEGWLLT
jgi:hypothetical protein